MSSAKLQTFYLGRNVQDALVMITQYNHYTLGASA